jgi:hypothetical protein
LRPEDGKYKLRILEFEQEHSYFHDFELLKITNPKELKVGVVNNKIVFYKDPRKPTAITNDKGKGLGDVLNGNKIFKGKTGDILKLKFKDISDQYNVLVWQASLRAGYPRVKSVEKTLKKIKNISKLEKYLKQINFLFLSQQAHASLNPIFAKSINFGILSSDKSKSKKIGICHPRENFSTGLLDISSHLIKSQSQQEVTLEWTNTHNLKLISLAQSATPKEMKGVKIESLKLESLLHSSDAKITKKDFKKGVELIPGQYLELTFPYEKPSLDSNQTTSFVLKSKGYYKKFKV